MAIFLFALILGLGLFGVEKLLIAPISLLLTLHLPTNLMLVGGLFVLAWLLAE